MADLEENRNEKLVDLLNTSYEQGVVDALLWVNEECNKKPDDDCDEIKRKICDALGGVADSKVKRFKSFIQKGGQFLD